jgi:probable HAF family extracellular repeat protein
VDEASLTSKVVGSAAFDGLPKVVRGAIRSFPPLSLTRCHGRGRIRDQSGKLQPARIDRRPEEDDMSLQRLCIAVALGSVASLVVVAPLSAQPVPIDLGTLGGTWSHAAAVNNRGQVVGSSALAGSTESRAFLWEDGVMHDLGGRFSSATGINDRGQIVGDRFDFDTQTIIAMLWENGHATALPALTGSNGCHPTAINQRGVIVGWCGVVVLDGLATQAVLVRWVDRVIEPLASLDVEAFPTAINDAGAIIGLASSPPRTDGFFFLWQDGVLSHVDQLTGHHFENVTGINKHGDLTGYSQGTRSLEALVWDGRTVVALPGLPGSFATLAYGINDHGEVAGVSVGGIGHNFPVVWTRRGIVVLGTVPANYITPIAISDRGDVIGDAARSSDGSDVRALLWARTTHAG